MLRPTHSAAGIVSREKTRLSACVASSPCRKLHPEVQQQVVERRRAVEAQHARDVEEVVRGDPTASASSIQNPASSAVERSSAEPATSTTVTAVTSAGGMTGRRGGGRPAEAVPAMELPAATGRGRRAHRRGHSLTKARIQPPRLATYVRRPRRVMLGRSYQRARMICFRTWKTAPGVLGGRGRRSLMCVCRRHATCGTRKGPVYGWPHRGWSASAPPASSIDGLEVAYELHLVLDAA